MKAKIKATGEVVDVEPLFYSVLSSSKPMIHRAELEFQPIVINWEQRRYELARAAMQGMLSNPTYDVFDNGFSNANTQLIVSSSIVYADEMIKQLKGGSRCD